MTHAFTLFDRFFLFDVESNSLHEADKILYDCFLGREKGYTQTEINDAKAEVEALRAQGLLDAPPAAPRKSKTAAVAEEIPVKALCLHISHDCNLSCTYCFAAQGTYKGARANMPLDVAKAAIDLLVEKSGARKNLEVDFFGGEPLLNFEVLKQTVEYANARAKSAGKVFKFTTTTNGLLLDAETSRYLNENMDNVVLSLDGRKSIHDTLRKTCGGKGSYDVIVPKFQYFRSIRGDKSYYVRGTYTANNLDFSADVAHIRELGFDQISVEPVVLPDGQALALDATHAQAICAEYEKLAAEYVSARKRPETWFSFFHFVADIEQGPCLEKRLAGCGAGCDYLAVTPDGSIYPCHQFAGESAYLIGNVFDKRLSAVVRAKFAQSNVATKTGCDACFAKYYCGGGCSAAAVHYSGDINIPHAFSCLLLKKRLECALYVLASEQ